MENNLQHENAELKARLRAFAAIMRLGRDAFEQPDLTTVGVHIVNNSRTLLAYESSCLADMRGKPVHCGGICAGGGETAYGIRRRREDIVPESGFQRRNG